MFCQELFRHLPQQRHLDTQDICKAAKLLQMQANKKLLQQELCQSTGKVVLLKDLHNLSLVTKKGQSRNNLDITIQQLIEKHGMYMI